MSPYHDVTLLNYQELFLPHRGSAYPANGHPKTTHTHTHTHNSGIG